MLDQVRISNILSAAAAAAAPSSAYYAIFIERIGSSKKQQIQNGKFIARCQHHILKFTFTCCHSSKQASSNQVSRLRWWWFICGWPSFQCHKICFFRFSLSPPSIFLVSLLFYSFIYEKTIGHSSSILAIPFLNDAVSFSRTRFRFCVFFCGCLTFFPSLFNWFLWVSKYLVKTGSYISWNAAYTHYTKIQRIVLCACVCVCPLACQIFWTGRNTGSRKIPYNIHHI